MKVSIITQFYDEDYNKISDFIKSLKNISFNKEVIFVDDRNDKSIDIRKLYNIPNEYKIIWSNETGKNVGTFEARRTGTLNASGDYIWFVDIDDELIDIKDINSCTDEIVCYSYNIKNNENLIAYMNIFQRIAFKRIKITNPITADYINNIIVRSLWNKLFKTDLIKKTFDNIPFLNNFKNYEDGYLIHEILKNRNIFVEFHSQAIYNYTSIDKQETLFKEDSESNDILALISSRIPNCPDQDEYIKLICSTYIDL